MDLAALDRHDAAHGPDQGRLARAVRPDQRQHLAGFNGQADVLQARAACHSLRKDLQCVACSSIRIGRSPSGTAKSGTFKIVFSAVHMSDPESCAAKIAAKQCTPIPSYQYPWFFARRSTHRKKGAPASAVTMPTGTICGASTDPR